MPHSWWSTCVCVASPPQTGQANLKALENPFSKCKHHLRIGVAILYLTGNILKNGYCYVLQKVIAVPKSVFPIASVPFAFGAAIFF